MFQLRWNCAFTVISLVLACVYFILLLPICVYVYRLMRISCAKRQSQRVFLLFVSVQCLLRCLYFLAWPLVIGASDDPECAISAEGAHDSLLMSIAGSIPSALFISAFSVNAWTFARIYHRTLRRNQSPINQSNHIARSRTQRAIVVFLLLCNGAVYASLILLHVSQFSLKYDDEQHDWLIDNGEGLYFYTLTCSAFLVGVTFAVYGWLLYRGVQQSIDQQSINQSTTQLHEQFLNVPFEPPYTRPTLTEGSLTSSFSSLSLTSDGSSINQSPHQSTQPNRLLKLAVVSSLCLLCFLVRVVLLPVLESVQDAQFSFSLLLLYLCCSEVLPLLLILYLFDPLKNQTISHSVDQSNLNQHLLSATSPKHKPTSIKNHWHDAINQLNSQSDQLWEDGYLPARDDQWWPISYDPYQTTNQPTNQLTNQHDELSQPGSPVFSVPSSSSIGSIGHSINQDILSTSSANMNSPSVNHSLSQSNTQSFNQSLSPRPRVGLTYEQAFKIDLKTALMQND